MEYLCTQEYELCPEYPEVQNLLRLFSEEILIWLLVFSGIHNLQQLVSTCREGLDLGVGQASDGSLPGKVIARIRRLWAFTSLDQFLEQLASNGLCEPTQRTKVLAAQRPVAIEDEAPAFAALKPFAGLCSELALSARTRLIQHAEARQRVIETTAENVAQGTFGCSASRIALNKLIHGALIGGGQDRPGDRGEAAMMLAPDTFQSCLPSYIHQPAAVLLERIHCLQAALAWRELAALRTHPLGVNV